MEVVKVLSPETLVVERQVIQVAEVVRQGQPGPPGPSGGTVFTRLSGTPISALQVVWEDAVGEVYPLDFEDAGHIRLLSGLTLTAAPEAGQEVTVQRSGPVNAAGLGLVPGPVWLGQNGALTQSPTITGFDLFVGTAVASGRLYLNFSDAITLED